MTDDRATTGDPEFSAPHERVFGDMAGDLILEPETLNAFFASSTWTKLGGWAALLYGAWMMIGGEPLDPAAAQEFSAQLLDRIEAIAFQAAGLVSIIYGGWERKSARKRLTLLGRTVSDASV